ncbi:hypothetical protein HPP92_029059 [Vanilla planifolia]|uniref:Uncharacterized protein n=1 Tax=Vanilla planifolia TaxID=51239 RepID=A0A835U2J9_VANPL|nr:hypothetical protein HPP92_029059 [Vanilla planifolia]KAG0446002.1 hypothetical protein HPP92_029048 [Vanilla planifolia]
MCGDNCIEGNNATVWAVDLFGIPPLKEVAPSVFLYFLVPETLVAAAIIDDERCFLPCEDDSQDEFIVRH